MATSGFDPFATDRAAIDRRRAMALALQKQALTPAQTQSVGGIAIRNSPVSALTPLVQALMSQRGMGEADQAETALNTKIQDRRGADMALLANALGGRQASPGGLQEDASGNVTPTDPVKALSPAQTLQQAIPMIQDPQLQQFGLQAAQTAQTKADEQAFRAGEAEQNRLARMQDRALALETASQNASLAREERAARAAEAAALRRELAANADQTRRDLAGQAAAARAEAAANKPLNESQGNAVLFGSRAALADRVLQDLEGGISTTGLALKRGVQNLPVVGGAAGALANTVLSKDQQSVEQAQRDFVNAILRKESGANIAPSEFDNAVKQYFPSPGDSEQVLKQKRQNRATAIAGLKAIAGPGVAQIDEILKTTPRLTQKKDAPADGISPELQALLDQYAPQP